MYLVPITLFNFYIFATSVFEPLVRLDKNPQLKYQMLSASNSFCWIFTKLLKMYTTLMSWRHLISNLIDFQCFRQPMPLNYWQIILHFVYPFIPPPHEIDKLLFFFKKQVQLISASNVSKYMYQENSRRQAFGGKRMLHTIASFTAFLRFGVLINVMKSWDIFKIPNFR